MFVKVIRAKFFLFLQYFIFSKRNDGVGVLLMWLEEKSFRYIL